MKTHRDLLVVFGLVLIAVPPVAAQVSTSNKLTPQKFCSSSDNSLGCAGRRNQENIDQYVEKYKDDVRKAKEKQDAERLERDRQRTVKDKDCNPRVRRCD